MNGFDKIAPYLSDPLVLSGFAIFLFFSFCRALLERGIIPQLTRTHGYNVVKAILLYGFLIGLAVLLLGFALKYRELSHAEQSKAVSMLRSEYRVNRQVLSDLTRNLESMINAFDGVARSLRTQKIPVLATLFPEANLRKDLDQPPPRLLAIAAIQEIAAHRLHQDQLELDKANRAGKAIVGTIDRTRVTISSLADADHRRYVFRDEAYRSQLPILRRVDLVDLTTIEQDYAELTRIRNSYDAVVRHLLEYFSVVERMFAPDDIEVDEASLTRILTAERMAISTLMTFTPDLVDSAKRVEASGARLGATDQR